MPLKTIAFCPTLSLAMTVAVAAPALAEQAACPDLGLSSDYLSAVFCAELAEIPQPRTRGVDADPSGATAPNEAWLALPMVEEAWRSDPAKTLALIARIRAAGGTPIND